MVDQNTDENTVVTEEDNQAEMVDAISKGFEDAGMDPLDDAGDKPLLKDEIDEEAKPDVDTKPDEDDEKKPEVDEKAELETKEDEKADIKPDESVDAKPDEDAKPSDEFEELPTDVKKETRERFDTMRGRFDEVSNELTTAKKDLETANTAMTEHVERSEAWADTIKATGTNPEQFAELMNYATDINSGTPEGMERAYQTLKGDLAILAKHLGHEAPGVNPLDDHADLKAEYDAGDLTRERALEIAKGRQAAVLNAARATIDTTKTNGAAARETALNGLAEVGARLKTDPHYEAKQPELVRATELIVQSEPDSSKWPAMVEAAFQKIPDPPSILPARPAAPNSIRPGPGASTAGDLQKEPTTALEAVRLGLANL